METTNVSRAAQEHRIAASDAPAFAPFVTTCLRHGIGKTTAYELAEAGLLTTFTIGRRRYVDLESLRTLPGRLAAQRKAA